jgi:putative DNA primase/helicase
MTRPLIVVDPGRIAWTVDEAEKAILQNYREVGLYQRGDFLVRAVVATADDDPRNYVRRPPGSMILRTVNVASLSDIFDREIAWQNLKRHSIDCPAKVAVRYLSRVGSWHLPVLVGIVEAPVMRPDGSVLNTAGYDEVPPCFYSRRSRGRHPRRTQMRRSPTP